MLETTDSLYVDHMIGAKLTKKLFIVGLSFLMTSSEASRYAVRNLEKRV